MFDELRRFARNPGPGYTYTIKKKDGEYVVRFHKDGKWLGEGPTYYTTDKADAEGTAQQVVARMIEQAGEGRNPYDKETGKTLTGEEARREFLRTRGPYSPKCKCGAWAVYSGLCSRCLEKAQKKGRNPSRYTPINAPLRVRRAWAHRAHISRRKNLRKNLNACQGMLQDMVDTLDTRRAPASNPELLVWRNPVRRRKGFGVSGLVVKRRKTSMRRRRRKHRRARNGKITAMLRGRRTGWKGFVKYYGGPKKAKGHWRKARKYHGGKSVCGGKKRRKSRKGRKRRSRRRR